jgi:hypothetical protein
MNTSHVGTNGTTGERGQSEQGQPWRKVVRGAEMPGESGYGIRQYEDGGNRRRTLSGRPAAIKQDGSDEDAAAYSRKSRNETDAQWPLFATWASGR